MLTCHQYEEQHDVSAVKGLQFVLQVVKEWDQFGGLSSLL